MVTSELSFGRTVDLESRLRWRLDAIYQGAQLAVGHNVLAMAAAGQVQIEPIRRLLAQRLKPIVEHLMAEECGERGEEEEDGQDGWCGLSPTSPTGSLKDGMTKELSGWRHEPHDELAKVPVNENMRNPVSGKDRYASSARHNRSADLQGLADLDVLPEMSTKCQRLGLRLSGCCIEWLTVGCSSMAELVLEDLLADLSAVLRVESSGSRSRPLYGGPGTSVRSTPTGHMAMLSWRGRVLAATPSWHRLAALDRGLLLAIADGVGPAAFGQAHRSLALEELSDLWLHSASEASNAGLTATGRSEETARRHRMVSIRIYPDATALCKEAANRNGERGEDKATSTLIERENSALILSVIQEQEVAGEGIGAQNGVQEEGGLSPVTLLQSAENSPTAGPKGLLSSLWQRLLFGSEMMSDSTAQLLGLSGPNPLEAAILMDMRTGDAVALPSPWGADLQRKGKASSLQRLMYWINTLPPLDASRPQQYMCSSSYLLGGARRNDGIACWGILASDEERKVRRAATPETTKDDQNSLKSITVLEAVARLLRRLPRAPDLWSALGALEPPEPSERQ
eukprot:TRINITY_DN28965_c0_g2_i1.p1 TRINITY_DN28965_c0_g2~~TRINITY_DN28965_c0_g2_i1.p1  ORF type:complete len:659 (-),score=125.84 TRINITY_DN28965_c0_g2_i1:225-1931(-)